MLKKLEKIIAENATAAAQNATVELASEELDNINGGLASASCEGVVQGWKEPRSRTC